MNRLKVVWICHFSNKEIRERLPLSKNRSITFFKKIVGKKQTTYSDFAPWITNLIKEFEKFDNVEIHVISPHHGLVSPMSQFSIRGINYHFFNAEFPFVLLKRIIRFLTKVKPKLFLISRFIVKRIIKQIKPDIVNLIGTENPYYSITSLDIKDIPVFVSAQTVYTNPKRLVYAESADKFRWDLELKIHKKEKYFGCGGRMHRDLVLVNNPEAIIFKMFFPIQTPKFILQQDKRYDFVFFAAGVAKKKGIEDAIDALAIVKKKYPGITLDIVGRTNDDYKNILLEKIKINKLNKNIVFHDYFSVHSDMHQHITSAKCALLPIKLDVISSAVIEAVFLDLPVITYKTTGTPYLNSEKQSVLISEIDDINALAENMLKLLTNSDLALDLRTNAKEFVTKKFNNTTSAKRLLADYYAVIEHYHDGTPIPKELLFDVDEFPIYGEKDE